jgi:hypothetical protein
MQKSLFCCCVLQSKKDNNNQHQVDKILEECFTRKKILIRGWMTNAACTHMSNNWVLMWMQWNLFGVRHSGPSPWRAACWLDLKWPGQWGHDSNFKRFDTCTRCIFAFLFPGRTEGQTCLKGLSHQIFKAFFMTCNIKSVLSAWALMVLKFIHLVVI